MAIKDELLLRTAVAIDYAPAVVATISNLSARLEDPCNHFIHDLIEYSFSSHYIIYMEPKPLPPMSATDTIELGYLDNTGIHISYINFLVDRPYMLNSLCIHEITHQAMYELFHNPYSAPYNNWQQEQDFMLCKQQVINNITGTEYEPYFIDLVSLYDSKLQDAEWIARYVENALDADEYYYQLFEPMTNYINEYIAPMLEG